jgi:glycosyltransferase involved in cell wall biosynthesis
VAWLIDGLGPGGAEELTAAYLPRLANRLDVSLGVLETRDENSRAHVIMQAGVPLERLRVRRVADPAGFARTYSFLRRRRAQLVHSHLEVADVFAVAAGRLLGIPTVATRHAPNEPVRGARGYRRQQLLWWSLQRATRVLAVSDAARTQLHAHGLAPERTATLYNGVDVERFAGVTPAEVASVERELALADAHPRILTVAVLRPGKGVDTMLDALPAVRAGFPTACYLVAGDGAERPALERRARRLGVHRHVRFLGSRADVPRLLALADVAVLPSQADLLPTAVIEAMAAATPVIASGVGGIPEIIEDGLTGRLVPPGDPAALARACRELLAAPARAAEIAERARAVAHDRFSLDRQVDRLAEIYGELLDA